MEPLALCDPLPTGQLKREKRAKIDRDWSLEKLEKRASTVRSPLGWIGVGLLFSTKVLWGVGRRLKDTGRRSQKSPWSPTSRVIGKAKPLTTKDTKERKGGSF